MAQTRELIDQALEQAIRATRNTVMTNLVSTKGSLYFSRDMFSNIPLIADQQEIAQHCEQRINENILRANMKRIQFEYAPGQKFLKKL